MVTFALAGAEDEAEIRRMLRENPVGGGWRIGMEREPDGFGGPHCRGERRAFVLARDDGAVVGLCERVVRPAFVDGAVRLLPYLGALRVAASHRHRIAILKGGFALLREQVERGDECGFALTSIASDNATARRVLTAGLPGLPRYRPLGDYATLMFRSGGRDAAEIAVARPDELPAIAAFLVAQLRRRQLAPVCDVPALTAQPELSWLVRREGEAIRGAIAVWDQRASRQAVIRGVPARSARLRRPANMLVPLLGLPAIPAVGQRIEQVYLAFLMAQDDDAETAIALIRAGCAAAVRRGAAVATLGLPAAHPWRAAIRRRLRAIEYRTELFAVHWPEAECDLALPGALPFPEAALL